MTGSAHAALAPYWAERLGRNAFTALQASKRTGMLHCRLEADESCSAAVAIRSSPDSFSCDQAGSCAFCAAGWALCAGRSY